MKSALSFVSVVLVGLLGSLHSRPADSQSSITSEQEVEVQDGLTVVTGMIEALHPGTQTATIRTDQNRILFVRWNSGEGLAGVKVGTRLHVEIDWNGADWTSRLIPEDSHSRMRGDRITADGGSP